MHLLKTTISFAFLTSSLFFSPSLAAARCDIMELPALSKVVSIKMDQIRAGKKNFSDASEDIRDLGEHFSKGLLSDPEAQRVLSKLGAGNATFDAFTSAIQLVSSSRLTADQNARVWDLVMRMCRFYEYPPRNAAGTYMNQRAIPEMLIDLDRSLSTVSRNAAADIKMMNKLAYVRTMGEKPLSSLPKIIASLKQGLKDVDAGTKDVRAISQQIYDLINVVTGKSFSSKESMRYFEQKNAEAQGLSEIMTSTLNTIMRSNVDDKQKLRLWDMALNMFTFYDYPRRSAQGTYMNERAIPEMLDDMTRKLGLPSEIAADIGALQRMNNLSY